MNNIKELRNTLASLYSEEGAIRAFVDIGCTSFKSVSIDFSGSALRMWTSVLSEAMKHSNGIDEILSNAIDEYTDNEIIKKNLADRQSETKTQNSEVTSYIPFRNILNNINKDNFGEIRRVDCNRDEQVIQYYSFNKEPCLIVYSIGSIQDKPNSFAERMMLSTLEDYKHIDRSEQNCWLYRKLSGDRRVDEIPFQIRPVFEISKNNFCSLMESLCPGLNMDNIKEYFSSRTYKSFSISIDYNYSLGRDILEQFTSWLYDVFSGVEDVKFRIFFVFNGFSSQEELEENISKITHSLKYLKIAIIKVTDPVVDLDIKTWKRQINIESYTQEEFLKDLAHLNISENDIAEYKKSKFLTMLTMEKFQSNLYDAYYKKT